MGPNRAVREALMKHDSPKLKKGRGLSSVPRVRRDSGRLSNDVVPEGALAVDALAASDVVETVGGSSDSESVRRRLGSGKVS